MDYLVNFMVNLVDGTSEIKRPELALARNSFKVIIPVLASSVSI